MKLILRSTLFALFVISSFLLLATAPVSIFIESNPYLSSWPRATLFLYAAVAGIVSNAKASFLLPIRNFSGFRFLHQIMVTAMAIAVLVGLGGYVLDPPKTPFPINLEYSWPFVVTTSFAFTGYLLTCLFGVTVGNRSMPDKDGVRLMQRWIAKPFTPFRLISLIATDDALIVIRPGLFKTKEHEFGYAYISRVRIEGWKFFVSTVHIDSIRGEKDSEEISMMPRERAKEFAKMVMRRVDFVTRASASASLHHAALPGMGIIQSTPAIESTKTVKQLDESEMPEQRDFKREREDHREFQNKRRNQ